MPAGQDCAPTATPWQYWVMTPDHSSLPVPRPFKNFWTYGASPDCVTGQRRVPAPVGALVPHWDP